MRKLSKEELEKQNFRLSNENLIMLWHIQDLYDNVEPDIIEINENLTAKLYRSISPCSGYVVLIEQTTTDRYISFYYLDDIYVHVKNLSYSKDNLPLKIITEKLYCARNKILNELKEV